MFTVKQLASMYSVSAQTMTRSLQRCGVGRYGKGKKPLLGYVELLPFFRKYGDRTGSKNTLVEPRMIQLDMFRK